MITKEKFIKRNRKTTNLISDNPEKCPICKSIDISSEFEGQTGVEITMKVECSSCNEIWYEIYKFVEAQTSENIDEFYNYIIEKENKNGL